MSTGLGRLGQELSYRTIGQRHRLLDRPLRDPEEAVATVVVSEVFAPDPAAAL